jgi:hypothetical protein
MGGTGHADGLVILQVPGNKADAVPCERFRFQHAATQNHSKIDTCLKSLNY